MSKKAIILLKMVGAMSPFILFGIIYKSMGLYPNYLVNSIDTSGLYNAELSIFGVMSEVGRVIPGKWFMMHHCMAADIFAGISYLCWVPLPVAYGFYLFFSGHQRLCLRFTAGFLFVNLIGFVFYYVHPASPPWYVLNYGFDVNFSTPGNVGQFSRFDELLGFPVFHSIYAQNANVFAAVPSLHSAYMPVTLFYALKQKPRNRWWVAGLTVIMFGIWFAAVYSTHHYVIDVLLGILCVIIGLSLWEGVIMRWSLTKGWFDKLSNLVC